MLMVTSREDYSKAGIKNYKRNSCELGVIGVRLKSHVKLLKLLNTYTNTDVFGDLAKLPKT